MLVRAFLRDPNMVINPEPSSYQAFLLTISSFKSLISSLVVNSISLLQRDTLADGYSMLSMPYSVSLFGGTALNNSWCLNVWQIAIHPCSRGVWFLYRLDLGVSVTNLALVQVTQVFKYCTLKSPALVTF